MQTNVPKKKAAAFGWAMFFFYFAFIGSSGFFEDPSFEGLGSLALTLVFMAGMLYIILRIISSPHLVSGRESPAPAVLFWIGLIGCASEIVGPGGPNLLEAFYFLASFASMGWLIGLYKKTGSVVSDFVVEKSPEPEIDPVDRLSVVLGRAVCFGSEDEETERAIRRCSEMVEGIREKELPIPAQTALEMCRIAESYVDLADDVVSTEKTRTVMAKLGRVFPVMAEGLENIYNAGVLKDLSDAEIEAEVLESKLRMSGLLDSDFEKIRKEQELGFPL